MEGMNKWRIESMQEWTMESTQKWRMRRLYRNAEIACKYYVHVDMERIDKRDKSARTTTMADRREHDCIRKIGSDRTIKAAMHTDGHRSRQKTTGPVRPLICIH